MGTCYHVSKSALPEQVLSNGLNWERVGFARHGDFNPPGVYVFDNLAITRRVFPRSRVYLYEIDTSDLPMEKDRWGGEGAWRITAAVSPERIAHIYTYLPWEKALTAAPSYTLQRD
jgi:hypothetical protein